MGNRHSVVAFPYTRPVTEPLSEDRSPIYRAVSHPNELVETLQDGNLRIGWDIFQIGMSKSRNSNMLGRRRKIIAPSAEGGEPQAPAAESAGSATAPAGSGTPGTAPAGGAAGASYGNYEWLTYEEVEKQAKQIGTAILKNGLAEFSEFTEEKYEPAQKMRLIGIMAKNCVEWFVMEQAANAYNFTLVPLYDTLGDEAINYILTTTKMSCVSASLESAIKLLEVYSRSPEEERLSKYGLKSLVVFEEPNQTLKELADLSNIKINYYYQLIEEVGDATLPLELPTPKMVNTLCYTSGTTGVPKGVIVTHGMLASVIASSIRGPLSNPNLDLSPSEVHISYLPLAHVFERAICNLLFSVGASIGVYSGDPQKLLDDMKVLRPTVFISVPRLFMRINDKITRGVAEKSNLAQYLFNTGLSSKTDKLKRKADPTDTVWDRFIFNKTKALLGGKVKYMLSGSAPLDAAVQDKMTVLFCAWLLEGYGLTETLGASFLRLPGDANSGHIGGTLACNEFCLESVHEMNYSVKNDPPCGELLLRGHSVFPGYFLNPTQTAEVLDSEGWFRTGDIAAVLPGGALKIIDRKKNIFKLSQGEYVAPERIENICCKAPSVSQIFVYGEPSKPCLVAIVVPDEDAVDKWKEGGRILSDGQQAMKLTLEEICKHPDFVTMVKGELMQACSDAKLKGFEKPQQIYVCAEPFTLENELLTSTMKLKRHVAKQRFQEQLAGLYDSYVSSP